MCTNNGKRVPSISARVKQYKMKTVKSQISTEKPQCTNIICDPVALNDHYISDETDTVQTDKSNVDDIRATTVNNDTPSMNTDGMTLDVKVSEIEDEQRINDASATDGRTTCVLYIPVAENRLRMLQTDKNSNNNGQWDDKTPSNIQEQFGTGKTLATMRDVELKVVVRYLKKMSLVVINESCPKAKKVEKLCSHFKLENVNTKQNESQTGMTRKTLRKIDLNIIYAEYIWERQYANLRKKCDIIKPKANQDILLLQNEYFYTGSYRNERNQFEVSCVDSSHLLTRTRRNICKGGIEGMTNKPWKRVAKSKQTNLSIAMTETTLEPMSVPVVVAHFSQTVENQIDVRLWWKTEDDPGVSATERVNMRMPIRSRLLKVHNHSHFPLPGVYFGRWPAQLWEALLANIDTKILLYGLCHGGTYNVRAFSSMMGETLMF
ncbi:hypothetical protein MAR_005567 [Mya arenaria]|uniref:Uncharacterized protein n=1 Tax=Mya arenaria TaxID=6604 RepID=A0ABY7F315_MYAAR|nr:hypothetical protein MAR_005567 [Mya arenaria]